MKTSEAGLNLIKSFEGLRLESYLCPAQVWTIGYGHTQGVKPNQIISEKQAESLLKGDLLVFEKAVLSHNLKLNQNQFDALVSFCYNVGSGNLAKSTLLRKAKLNPNDETIRDEFMKWNKAKGKELAGLTRRRRAEADSVFTSNYLKGNYKIIIIRCD